MLVKCLAQDADDRFATVGDLVRALDEVIALHAKPPPRPAPPGPIPLPYPLEPSAPPQPHPGMRAPHRLDTQPVRRPPAMTRIVLL